MRVARRSRVLFVLWGLVAASSASAQDYNPRLFPVGEEALSLGGAFVGRASDASAAYYNPAGLAFGRSGSVGLSLALNVLDRYQLDGVTGLDVAFDVTDTQGVPFFAGASTQFGGNEETGEGRHAIAAATLAPRSSRRRFVFGGDEGALDVARQDSTRWYGVAYSYRPVPSFSLGLGAFVAIRRMEHRETELGLTGPEIDARFSETRINAEKLIFRVGALYRPVPQLSLGLTFQAPAIVLGARANTIATSSADRVLRTGSQGAHSPLPWELRLGVAWEPFDTWLITGDVALSGPIGSAADPVFLVEPDADGTPVELLTRFLADRYHTDTVFDFAVGTRVMVADVVPLAAGLFSSFSAAPVIPATAPDYAPDRVHRIGATLSAGYRDEAVNFSVGVMGALGFGHGLILDESGMGPLTRATIESQTLVVFLSGAVGAALQVGRQLVEEVVNPMLNLDEDDPEDAETAPEAGGAPTTSVDGSESTSAEPASAEPASAEPASAEPTSLEPPSPQSESLEPSSAEPESPEPSSPAPTPPPASSTESQDGSEAEPEGETTVAPTGGETE